MTFLCNTIGPGFTVFQGSALDCEETNHAIVLFHNRFDGPRGANGTCNDGDIMGHIFRVKDSYYTSEINVTVSSSLIGKTIRCSHDNGTAVEVVGSYSFTSGKVEACIYIHYHVL